MFRGTFVMAWRRKQPGEGVDDFGPIAAVVTAGKVAIRDGAKVQVIGGGGSAMKVPTDAEAQAVAKH